MVSPDGRSLLDRTGSGASADLRVRACGGTSCPFVATAASEQEGRFSPDGQRVAYTSDVASSGLEVHVRAFPDGGTAFRAPQGGGQRPVWGRDHRSITHVPRRGLLVRARLSPLACPTSVPQVLGRDTLVRSGYDVPCFRCHANYDVSPDGQLVLLRPLDGAQRLVPAPEWLSARRRADAPPQSWWTIARAPRRSAR